MEAVPLAAGPAGQEPAVAVRDAIERLNALEPGPARRLEQHALLLTRIAAADRDVTHPERCRIEELLSCGTPVPGELAALAVEIAARRLRCIDPAGIYRVSRELRASGDVARERLLEALLAVAVADGRVDPAEQAELLQVVTELGLDLNAALAALQGQA
jgi:tellurite resistance protein